MQQLPKKKKRQPTMKSEIRNTENIYQKIKEVKFFNMYRTNDSVIREIADLCTVRKFRKGSVIISEGDYGDELFIFLNGRVEISKQTMQNEPYTLMTKDADTGGFYVGEFALIDNNKRSATITALTECNCLVMKRDKFIQYGDNNPEIGLNVTRAIAREISMMLRNSNTDVITLFSALVEEIAGD
jgi:CRP/FNR family transcriptional regulator, cyclic AMP receptor protein